MPMMDPAASNWRILTAEVSCKVVDLLQPRDPALNLRNVLVKTPAGLYPMA